MSDKIIIYQIFTRLHSNRCETRIENGTLAQNGSGKMNDIDSKELKRLKAMGITHVWYTGVIRHASQTDYSDKGFERSHPAIVKGKAGSPYAIIDYYDVDPDLAYDASQRMEEFEQLVSRTHAEGLKMIIDFVPNHVARQYHSTSKPVGVADLGEGDDPQKGFDPQNNFYYCPGCTFSPHFSLAADGMADYVERPAKATGNDHFGPSPSVNDWYETVKLNYGVDYYAGRIGHFSPTPSTWHKMLDILLFWAAKGVDGFRCDMAEMVPAEFWAWATEKVKAAHPDILFIGEVYNPGEYRHYIASGFDYLYDKVGMYDTVRAVTCGQCPATAITGAWQTVDDIRSKMLYFLENHDEQRLASDFFAGSGRHGVPALVVSALFGRNPFMLYAAQEYGERGMDKEGFSGRDGRTTIFDYWSIDTLCRAAKGKLSSDETELYAIYNKVLGIVAKERAVAEGESFDLMYANNASDGFDPSRHFAFLRKAGCDMLLVAANFSDSPAKMSVRIPAHAFDFLGIDEKRATATEQLTGEKMTVKLVRDGSIDVNVEAWGAAILKMKASR